LVLTQRIRPFRGKRDRKKSPAGNETNTKRASYSPREQQKCLVLSGNLQQKGGRGSGDKKIFGGLKIARRFDNLLRSGPLLLVMGGAFPKSTERDASLVVKEGGRMFLNSPSGIWGRTELNIQPNSRSYRKEKESLFVEKKGIEEKLVALWGGRLRTTSNGYRTHHVSRNKFGLLEPLKEGGRISCQRESSHLDIRY